MKRYAFLLLLLVSLAACTDSNVELVKGGTMLGYDQTTIGNAFDASFDDPQWTSETTKKGTTKVVFTGLISQETHDLGVYPLLKNYNNLDYWAGDRLYSTGTSNLAYYGMEEAQKIYGKEFCNDVEKNLENKYGRGVPQDESARMAYYTELFDIIKEIVHDNYWIVGSPVEFVWIVSPDEKDFQLAEFANESWANRGTTLKRVLQAVYSE